MSCVFGVNPPGPFAFSLRLFDVKAAEALGHMGAAVMQYSETTLVQSLSDPDSGWVDLWGFTTSRVTG